MLNHNQSSCNPLFLKASDLFKKLNVDSVLALELLNLSLEVLGRSGNLQFNLERSQSPPHGCHLPPQSSPSHSYGSPAARSTEKAD
ncbi:hypothetical protein DSO57_1037469 [Entomophthora muscae]|uniref:Uncharacterized protein n=1 Tax=Entomophthora muscae TaxID=34485 RepID=A0ACC2SBP7_9FUNG|nr:hypothetical protein DSO57_1037469 [Entomophthora muscae]